MGHHRSPRLGRNELPTVESLVVAHPDPVALVAEINRLANLHGTLPGEHAELRRRTLINLRRAGLGPGELAARTGISSPRVTQLTDGWDTTITTPGEQS